MSKKAKLKIRREIRNRNVQEIMNNILLFMDNGVKVHKFNDYQYRFYTKEKAIDYYPTSKRCCDIDTATWYTSSLQEIYK